MTEPSDPPESVPDLVRAVAARHPDVLALAWPGEELTYRELVDRAASVATALPAGQPVAVRMSSGPRQVIACLAVLMADARLVCLGAGDVGERGRAVLTDLRPTWIVVDGEQPEDGLVTWYREELSGRVLDLTTVPAGGAGERAVPGSADGWAYVTYTSGSTGRPKGIPQGHSTLAQFVTWFAREFRVEVGARVAQWAAPGYDASLVEAFGALVAGGTLCPVSDRLRANPEKLADWLAAEGITHFQTVPSFARQLLGALGEPGERPAALGHLLLAGEPLPGELADGLRAALPGVRLVNLYGPTESILATWYEVDGPHDGMVPIGRAIPGRRVVVLDEHDRPCPPGVTGQIVIESPYVTPGYVGAAGENGAAFRPIRGTGPAAPRCYRTGDRGRLRPDGTLEFGGREDFQIKFNGVRVELTDIEVALAADASVAECAVVPVADAQGLVVRLVAYVVPGEPGGTAATITPWRAALRRRFGKATPPVTFRTLTRLPRTVGGKVDRRRLPDPGPATAQVPRARDSGAAPDGQSAVLTPDDTQTTSTTLLQTH
ncbi:amino acid adenylation domain-containing protein [Sphaerisporangium aureirubrum]|uniref:Amino acid adenylation domain-containing protein n=1 Tax=Sphaerisporangium aureirubrum TaxID=1544736 RepID=A0ABW1NEU0_9ACTN